MIDKTAMYKLSYGLYLISSACDGKNNGCIINTAVQITDSPCRISVAVNKQNFTHDQILKSGVFNLSVLTENTPFGVFEAFGFRSGRDVEKFDGTFKASPAENGILKLDEYSNAYISAKVVQTLDFETHTVFIAEATDAGVISDDAPVTYAYYHQNIKPKPAAPKTGGKTWVCTICGYIYDEDAEGVPFEDLPDDWTCPLCKHPKSDFELQK